MSPWLWWSLLCGAVIVLLVVALVLERQKRD
jgi:hypothetical protein